MSAFKKPCGCTRQPYDTSWLLQRCDQHGGTRIVYPPFCAFDAEGYPQYWSDFYGCWFHPIFWDTNTGKVIYALQPKQWEALKLTPVLRKKGTPGPTRIGFGGSAGAAKSYMARAMAALIAQVWPGSTTAIIRETEKQVKDNHVTPFMREVPYQLYGINLSDLVVKWHESKSETHFRYLKHEKDLKNFQGPAYDALIFEEATLYPWSLVSWIIGNRNRATGPYSTPFAFFPSNPGGIGHAWFKRLFIDRRYNRENNELPDDHVFLPAKLADNYVLMKNDPGYELKLNTLPEPHRSWMRDGDFNAGAGAGIPQLARDRHLVPYFNPPKHWFMFGAFDWGFEHPFSFGVYVVNEDGRIFKVDTIKGRWLNPPEICDRIIEMMKLRGLNHEKLAYVATGHDAWAEHKARGESGITIAERMIGRGFPLIRANISRVSGLNNLREYLAWEHRFGPGQHDDPALVFMDTPGNRACYDVLESRTPDPDNIEDVIKTNADAFGQGGDDEYDETRYAINSRPARAPALVHSQVVSAWSVEALTHEMEQGRIVRDTPPLERGGLIHPEFGEIL